MQRIETYLDEADAKNFRKDLLFRLNVITLTIPPLRDRREDIIILANFFLSSKSPVRSPKRLSIEAAQILEEYDFTGNVRELGTYYRACNNFCRRRYNSSEDLSLPNAAVYKSSGASRRSLDIPSEILSMEDLERWHIAKVLRCKPMGQNGHCKSIRYKPQNALHKIKKYELKQD